MSALGALGGAPAVLATSGISPTINYQGRLLTNTGAVVPDGTYNFEFNSYQDGNGLTANVAGGVSVGGDLTVSGITNVADLDISGHIITGGSSPAVSALPGAGAGNAAAYNP